MTVFPYTENNCNKLKLYRKTVCCAFVDLFLSTVQRIHQVVILFGIRSMINKSVYKNIVTFVGMAVNSFYIYNHSSVYVNVHKNGLILFIVGLIQMHVYYEYVKYTCS